MKRLQLILIRINPFCIRFEGREIIEYPFTVWMDGEFDTQRVLKPLELHTLCADEFLLRHDTADSTSFCVVFFSLLLFSFEQVKEHRMIIFFKRHSISIC